MRPGWSVRRFDAIEMLLAVGFVGLLTWTIAHPRQPRLPEEAVALEQKYGPGKVSENAEEWIIRDFFHDRRGGIFVDVGASHYQINNNTYYLEHDLGWSGLAIEPFTHFEADYLAHRPRTRFLPFFVSDVSGQEAKMYSLGPNFLGNSTDKAFVERFGQNPKEFKAPTITLNDLLANAGISRFDFMSMDIELSEPKALAGFDIDRFKPQFVCIEAHPEVRQQILDYFARHGYAIAGKYLRADEKNLYFAPLSSTP